MIVEYGMRRMLDEQHDEFFYLTVTNENLAQPDMPADPAARGHPARPVPAAPGARPGPGAPAGLGPHAARGRTAADRLRDEYGVDAEVWSVTSYSELARDGREAERARLLGLPAARMPTGSGPAWAPARPRDRRQRLRARRARTDPRLGARALPHAGHRRFRPPATRGRSCATSSRSAATGSCCKRWTAWDARPTSRRCASGWARQRANAALGGETRGGRAIAAWPPPRRPFPHRPVPGSRSAVGRVPGRHYRLSSPPFLSRPARSPNRADFPPRSRASLIKVHPESAARCGAASASRPLSGEIRTFPGISPKNTRAPGPHFCFRFRFTVDGPRRPYPHGRHSR